MPTPTPVTGKLQGFRSQFSYLAPGGSGSQVQFKSLTGWDVKVAAKEIDASDHDTDGWEDTLSGLGKWTATVNGIYFEGDPTQTGVFNALVGALSGNSGNSGNITCSFFPQKGTVGDGSAVWTGTAIVTGFNPKTDNSGAQTLDITLSGRGPLVLSAQ